MRNLCLTCHHATVLRGNSHSHLNIFCDVTFDSVVVQFPVLECSSYLPKRTNDIERMEKIAWHIKPSAGRMGFVRPDLPSGFNPPKD
jgi:hypothetical protein